jgi:ATP-binding cassette subfamily B protein
VLDDGCVAEEGTHDQLVKHGGIYAAFAEEQQMEKELEEIEADPLGAGDAMARVAS